jgi:hypothetical protein
MTPEISWVARELPYVAVSTHTSKPCLSIGGLALELRARDIGDHEVLSSKVAAMIRVHDATRVQQCGDVFLGTKAACGRQFGVRGQI